MGTGPPRLFVSYSHQDARWLSHVETALKPLAFHFDLWSDRKIAAGSKWQDEIRAALANCAGGILLVSPSYLASDFVGQHELAPLLKASEANGIRIFWIAVSASLVDQTNLAAFQSLNDPAKPLDSLSRAELNKVLSIVARKIKDSLAAHPAEVGHAQPEQSDDPFSTLRLSFSSVAEASISTLGADRGQIVELLRSEFRSHPILRSIDYELSPRPLQQGYFALLTKSGSRVSVEHLSRCHMAGDQLTLWSDLCTAYAHSYSLPFRTDYLVLLKEPEYRRTSKNLASLLETLNRYIYQSPVYQDQQIFPKLHRLKQDAENSFVSAERKYESWASREDVDASGLGRIALELDRVISGVHKIILEYQCRQ
jgi:hypothetical protein